MPPRLAAKLVAVLLLAQGSSGCLVRLRRDLTPSEYEEIEHCLPWTRASETPDMPPCHTLERAWGFLREAQSEATCHRDEDCAVAYVTPATEERGPSFVAVNRRWWEREGRDQADALSHQCAIVDYIVNSPPEGAACHRGACRLRYEPGLLMSPPQEAACLRRFNAPLALPSWP